MPNTREYWDEVASIARDLIDEWRREPTTDLSQYLWETIDGNQYVIYTSHAKEVCMISPNDQTSFDYIADNFGKEAVIDEEGYIRWEAIAFGCLYADVMDKLDQLGFDLNSPSDPDAEEEEEEEEEPVVVT